MKRSKAARARMRSSTKARTALMPAYVNDILESAVEPDGPRYVCNEQWAEQPWQGANCMILKNSLLSPQDLSRVDELGTRWLLLLSDIDPPRGPKLSQTLSQLFEKATFAALQLGGGGRQTGFELMKFAEAGARVVLVVTEEPVVELWHKFLGLRAFPALWESGPTAFQDDEFTRRIETVCQRRARGQGAPLPAWPTPRCAVVRLDTEVTDEFVAALGHRWLLVIDDRAPSLGPSNIGPALTVLLGRATLATYETEPRDQFVYHDLLVGAIAGGRIVHVMTDPSHRDAWIERLEQHLPRVIRPYNERIE